MTSEKFNEIINYHEASKHHYDRYARSPGYMDWKNQPNPFRTYVGSPVHPLKLLKQDPAIAYLDLYDRKNNPQQPFTIETIAGFLELSLGLSAWKAAAGSRWSLRVNPSSGNLHPTEAHLILPPMKPINSGVYHYNALGHLLEKRADIPAPLWQHIVAHFGTEGFLIGISSIFWRESWKYGERAFRYCNHDAGHALACASFSANLYGWKVTYLSCLSDEEIEAVLGFDQIRFRKLEEEHTDFLCFVHPHKSNHIPRGLTAPIVSQFAELKFIGEPEILSQTCINWESIYTTARLTKKPPTEEITCDLPKQPWSAKETSPLSAPDIIRKRRSAASFDPDGSITKNQFLSMLDKTLARMDCAPFDAELIGPSTHLLIFVHNVVGLAAGLYFFLRRQNDLDEVRRLSRSDFQWEPVESTTTRTAGGLDFTAIGGKRQGHEVPQSLRVEPGAKHPVWKTQTNIPLYLLSEGDFRQQAMMVSCHQEIAGFSAFSVGMIVKFKEIVAAQPHLYRHLFWETGMIGQVLYLEAEAHGVRGTGIGCFFDDAVHEIMGFSDNHYQSLYHFTVGKPIEDPRLTTHPPYGHLKNKP
jgi:SagB-type dehydrogenase family enzyme